MTNLINTKNSNKRPVPPLPRVRCIISLSIFGALYSLEALFALSLSDKKKKRDYDRWATWQWNGRWNTRSTQDASYVSDPYWPLNHQVVFFLYFKHNSSIKALLQYRKESLSPEYGQRNLVGLTRSPVVNQKQPKVVYGPDERYLEISEWKPVRHEFAW